jgi:hypothetical protein
VKHLGAMWAFEPASCGAESSGFAVESSAPFPLCAEKSNSYE